MPSIHGTMKTSAGAGNTPEAWPNLNERFDVSDRTCSVDGCDRRHSCRGWCQAHYKRWKKRGHPGTAEIRGQSGPSACRVDGCSTDMGHLKTTYCSKHRARLERHGSTDLPDRPPVPPSVAPSTGYRTIYAAGHPLAMPGRNRQFEHRVVLYDKIGPGTHPCHHCEMPVTWHVDLQTDHLDDDKTNNDPANVVPTCRTCNTWRARYPETFVARLAARKARSTNGAAVVGTT